MAIYSNRIMDSIAQHADHLASEIRDTLDATPWLPDVMRRPTSAAGTHFFSKVPPPPKSFYEKTTAWVSEKRTWIAIGLTFASTTFVLVHKRKRAYARKRRARKFANGAKKEIVVVACSSFHDPLIRSVALDLERRGYYVDVAVSSTEEESLIHQEANADIQPLWIDMTSSVPDPAIDIHPHLEPIRGLIAQSNRPPSPSTTRPPPSASSGQNHILAGLVILPGVSGYPTGPFMTVAPSDLVDTINTRLLSPILIVQQFLPLLINYSNASNPASIVLAYPSIPQSLSSPYQMSEIVTTSSLSSFARCLRRELSQQDASVTITELKLGNFDLSSTSASNSKPRSSDYVYGHEDQETSSSALTATSSPWHSSQRAALQRSSLGQSSIIRGSKLKELHNAVFDALAPPVVFKAFGVAAWGKTGRQARTVYVGSGARLYDVVGKIAPEGLVGWIMGYKSSHGAGTEIRRKKDAEGESSRTNSAERAAGWGRSSASSESGIWEKV